MISKFFDYVWRQLLLTQDMRQVHLDVRELQQSLRRLETTVDRLASSLEHLQTTERMERDRQAEREEHEREKLMLRLQNTVLQLEKRLPSGE